MKVAIIGGGNVYALNLARHLSEIGVEHFGIGRSGPKHPAFWQVEHHYRFQALHLIDDFAEVVNCLDWERPDVVVNFAAQGEGAASFGTDSHLFYATNATALVKLAEHLRTRQYLKRFVQIGTSELYGSVQSPSKETDQLKPSSPYAISKACFDQHLDVMFKIKNFPMNIIRPSNAYCPGQQLHRIIPKTILCALGGKKLSLQGGGHAQKSYIHADDLSRAIVAVLERGKVGKTYNCGPVLPTKIRTVVGLCLASCGADWSVVEETPQRTGEDGCYWLDSSELTKDTNWKPLITLEFGIDEMVRWVKKYPDLLVMDTTFRIRP